MIRSFPWPHGDVKCFPAVVDVLWDCGQRGSVVHQIHSPSLPDSQFGVAARSLGRDHAPERIDLYPAGTPRPLTMIDIHVSREPERCVGDQTITGSHKTINFAGRLTAFAASSIRFSYPFIVAPLGTTPSSRNCQNAMANLLASATMPTLRPRIPAPAKRCRHHVDNSLSGW